jgi:hypothetical protein
MPPARSLEAPFRQRGAPARAIALAACLACGSVGACGGGETGGDGRAATAVASACATLADAYVTRTRQCAPYAGSHARAAAFRAREVTLCEREASLVGVHYDAASILACANAVLAEPCNRSDTPVACLPTTGDLPIGASCVDDAQCVSGRCGVAAGTGCGICVQTLSVGEPCGASTTFPPCGAGAFCGPLSKCVLLGQARAYAHCSGDAECVAGTFCATSADAPLSGICAATGKAGDTCAIDQECTDGLTCFSGVCLPTSALGEPCEPSGALICGGGLACARAADGTDRCTPPTFVSIGAPCGGSVECDTGACVGVRTSGQCQAYLADGDVCGAGANQAPCDVGSSCVMGRCIPVDGAVCSTD